MKRVFSILLATVMAVSMMAVPAFAGEVNGTTGYEKYVVNKDKWGNNLYISGTEYNTPVNPLSEAPAMDYVKTIEGVTFSNYIRHTTRNTKDTNGATITIHQVFIGLDGAMHSDKDNVEFMYTPGSFNYVNADTRDFSANGEPLNPSSDLAMLKTNTKCLEWNLGNSISEAKFTTLSAINIAPYADGGRNNDGTWNKGLTWVFHEDFSSSQNRKSDGSYTRAYAIRVNQGDTVTYFQVAVTDATNYSGSRVDTSKPTTPPVSDPVTVAPAKEATAKPNKAPIYINNVLTEFEAYNINGNNYFKLRDVALALRGTEKQFEVGWDSEKNAISLSSRTPYSGKAGSISTSNQQRKASRTNSAIYVDGAKTDFTAYQINGNNFFKLRDLGKTFNFYVGWDNATQSITIDTTKDYQ